MLTFFVEDPNVGKQTEYKVKIRYDVDSEIFDDGVPRRFTSAQIFEVDPVSKEMDPIAYGESICHPKDNFVKKIGRANAIKSAISYAYQANAVDPDTRFAKAALALIK